MTSYGDSKDFYGGLLQEKNFFFSAVLHGPIINGFILERKKTNVIYTIADFSILTLEILVICMKQVPDSYVLRLSFSD